MGSFLRRPPVRVPEVQIDAVLSLRGKEAPLEMAALGTALFLALSAASPGNILEELEKAKAQGMLAADFVERSVVEGFGVFGDTASGRQEKVRERSQGDEKETER